MRTRQKLSRLVKKLQSILFLFDIVALVWESEESNGMCRLEVCYLAGRRE